MRLLICLISALNQLHSHSLGHRSHAFIIGRFWHVQGSSLPGLYWVSMLLKVRVVCNGVWQLPQFGDVQLPCVRIPISLPEAIYKKVAKNVRCCDKCGRSHFLSMCKEYLQRPVVVATGTCTLAQVPMLRQCRLHHSTRRCRPPKESHRWRTQPKS